jgi:hypothetical protein
MLVVPSFKPGTVGSHHPQIIRALKELATFDAQKMLEDIMLLQSDSRTEVCFAGVAVMVAFF